MCEGRDCTVLSARIGLTYEDGTEATPDNGVYIHHLLSFSPNRPTDNAIGFCDVPEPEKDLGFNKYLPLRLPFSPFTGRGEDGAAVDMLFTSNDGKFNSGYHLGKDDYVLIQSDLVNYSNVTKNVFVTYEYEYVEGFQGISAITAMLSVTGMLHVLLLERARADRNAHASARLLDYHPS
jgi:hypothetical protein